MTIILSNPDGSEIPVQHTSKPIAIRLSRPADKRPKYQTHELLGTEMRYHKVRLLEKFHFSSFSFRLLVLGRFA